MEVSNENKKDPIMHNTEENRIAYVLAMATGMSGFAAQALLRAWGFEGPADITLACTLLYTLGVHAAVLMVWQPSSHRAPTRIPAYADTARFKSRV